MNFNEIENIINIYKIGSIVSLFFLKYRIFCFLSIIYLSLHFSPYSKVVMDNFFDQLSKDVASTVSRREAIRLVGGAVFGVFISAIGFSKEVIADTVCPSCGTCKNCNFDTNNCDQPCSDPCLAASLCNEAQTNQAFLKLSQYLSIQGFRQIGEPNALVSTGTLITPSQTLEIKFKKSRARTFAKPHLFEEQASIIYLKTGQTPSKAYLSVIKDGQLYYTAWVDDLNNIRFEYNSESGTTSLNTLLTSYDERNKKINSTVENNLATTEKKSAIPTDCELLCTSMCNIVTIIGCTLTSAAVCVVSGAGFPICFTNLRSICGLTSTAICFTTCKFRHCIPCDFTTGKFACGEICCQHANRCCPVAGGRTVCCDVRCHFCCPSMAGCCLVQNCPPA